MNYKFKTKPYAHQLTALENSWHKEEFAYFMEMGTGKTKVLIDNVAMLYDKGKVDGVLIIAPKGVVGTWYNQELPNHLADHIENVTVLWQANINKKQQEKLDQLFKTGHELHILVMNVEALSTDKGKLFAAKFLRSHKSMIAIDESTTIKNPKAKRTKNILSLGDICKYRRIMTGSPVTRNPLDLYSQCEFLNPNLLQFTSYYAFRNRYAEMKTIHVHGRSVDVVHKFQNLKLYEQMKKQAFATLNGKQVTSVTVLTQLMRLQQITCGHFTADDGSIQPIRNNRLAELLDVLEEIEGKVIIWGHYQEDVKNIVNILTDKYGPGSVVSYYGLTPQEERQKNIKKFQANNGVRFLVGTP